MRGNDPESPRPYRLGPPRRFLPVQKACGIGHECPRQRITLPNHDRSTAGLLPWPIRSEVCPPDLPSLQARSVASSSSAHSARPCSARARSSPFFVFANLAKSQRLGSGRRITIKLNGTTIVDADLDDVKDEEMLKSHRDLSKPEGSRGIANTKGHIGLLGHGARVEFRNLRIKEL